MANEFMCIVANRATGDYAVMGPMVDDRKLGERVAKANQAGGDFVLSTPSISKAAATAEAAQTHKGKLVPLSDLLP